ncbi:hypothetical protein GGQ80_003673 [Sphingomonas jinjuensis]|uniref:Uncharacterized protein n=1 Tax=Sphingomonas jinjuensis TaxID=535907 RepID=A0A840FPD5_9SPHN|nr:hypothetical protein [Sphingomonas jinjuensis]MBB4155748.1 hypothetical protein [Sphingomonas jinjuensis]
MDETNDGDINALLAMSEADLYARLAPADVAYDLQGRVAAGREALAQLLSSGKGAICGYYSQNKAVVRDASDLVKVLTEGLKIAVNVAGLSIPLAPAAVLLFKIGIEKVCTPAPAQE